VEAYYKRSPRVGSRVLDGEAVLVKMPESVLHVLNSSASRIWVRADGVRPLMEFASSPGEEPDVYPQDVEVPSASGPPEVRVSEAIETLASGTCGLLDEATCGVGLAVVP
jgi:hypothetical protein